MQKAVVAKPRFEILDGLRGVAALIVVVFHVFEIHSGGPSLQIINHGYLAVDFFFALSGFVLGYAYDDRWGRGLTTKGFILRRLIRLQPMVFMGATLGMLTFYFGLADISNTTVGTLLLVWLMSCFLIPVTEHLDVRGWGEGYALDGPMWTLAFEYIANLLYALFIRRFPVWLLACFVVAAAMLSVDVALNVDVFGLLSERKNEIYTMIGGWSLAPTQLYVGFVRLLYPFFAGLLVYRLGLRIKVRQPFLWSALLLAIVLFMPRVGLGADGWGNGLYEAFCVLAIFPVILMIGAGTIVYRAIQVRLCRFLGRLSYPLYITHYPLIYILFEWTYEHRDFPLSVHIFNGVAVVLASVGIAYAIERLYDTPVRSRLSGLLRRNSSERDKVADKKS